MLEFIFGEWDMKRFSALLFIVTQILVVVAFVLRLNHSKEKTSNNQVSSPKTKNNTTKSDL